MVFAGLALALIVSTGPSAAAGSAAAPAALQATGQPAPVEPEPPPESGAVAAEDDLLAESPPEPPGRGLVIGVLLFALVAAGGVLAYRHIVERRYAGADGGGDRDWPLPPLIVPPALRSGDHDSHIRPAQWPGGQHRADTIVSAPPPPVRTPGPGRPAEVPEPPAASPPPARPAPPRPAVHFDDDDDADEPAEEEVRVGSVVFHRPTDGTLQLLPGRLEVLNGEERVEEVRFVKVPGREAAVTFGRKAGEPHLHIRLDVPTVSRMHARMRYDGGRWYVENLSRTNPVLVRGEPLANSSAPALLEDGDEVEMGEIVFRFRSR